MHTSTTSVALVAYSSTSVVSGTYRIGVLGSRARIWMYVVRLLDEQEFGLVVVIVALWSKWGSV